MMGVRACCLVSAALIATSSSAYGKSKSDHVRAATLLADWQFDEARALIEALTKSAPKAPATTHLLAELAFIDGDYDSALRLVEQAGSGASAKRLARLASRTLEATHGFASRTSQGGHFVISYSPGKDEAIVDLASETLEAAYEALGDDLGVRPSRPIRVEILSAPADLAKVSTLTATDIETTGTIALCKYGKLMIVTPRATITGYAWMDTLVHEYAHYLISTASADRVPVWLHEGLARFEQIRWRSPPTGELTRLDAHLLGSALANRKLISFDAMHPSMAKLPSQQAAALAFTEVHTMVAFVHAKVGYAGIRSILRAIRKGDGAKSAVGASLGLTWRKAEREWKKYLQGQRLAVHPSLKGLSASRRIRFKKGSEDPENVGLEGVANAKARKFARLGGMLRARGLARAAAIEYEKALAAGGDDPYVAGKLARTYLDLGEHERAIALAKPLLGIDDNDAVAATTLGGAYLATGAAKDASSAFELALRTSPFDPAVRCGLAEAYSALGDTRATREQQACARIQ